MKADARPGASRPLRALTLVLTGWVFARAVALSLSTGPVPSQPQSDVTARAITEKFRVSTDARDQGGTIGRHWAWSRVSRIAVRPVTKLRVLHGTVPAEAGDAFPSERANDAGGSTSLPPSQALVSGGAPTPRAAGTASFAASAWLLARRGKGKSLGQGGELGGSQAGVRLYWAPWSPNIVLTGSATSPLGHAGGKEASVGVGYRGRRGGVFVERRFGLGTNGRDAMAITAFGGVSDIALPLGMKLDGYGQFGMVGLRSHRGFADGALRVEHPLASAGVAHVSAGAGIWGGIQPGIGRIDFGPQLVARIPIAKRQVRVSAEWRQRVAGHASPGSGPSITAGVDF